MTADIRLAGWQVVEEQRSFWRNRAAAFFNFVLPLMLLVVFATLNRDGRLTVGHHEQSYVSFFIPGILAYGLVNPSFMGTMMSTVDLRERGILKRMRGTPLPTWAYFTGRLGSMVVVGLILVAITLVLGVAAYGISLPGTTFVGFALTLLLGIACLAALGLGVTRFVPSAEAGRPIGMLIVLPLSFVSGIWYPVDDLPSGLQKVVDDTPLRAFADGLQHGFAPGASGTGIVWHDLLVLAVWTFAGVRLTRAALRAQRV
jgi:ABC-2 type transport system permease protein